MQPVNYHGMRILPATFSKIRFANRIWGFEPRHMDRGERSEWLVGEELERLKKLFYIRDYTHTDKNSPLDTKGIDFLVHREQHGQQVLYPLQVKSSEPAARKFTERHPDIPVVIGYDPHLREDLVRKLDITV